MLLSAVVVVQRIRVWESHLSVILANLWTSWGVTLKHKHTDVLKVRKSQRWALGEVRLERGKERRRKKGIMAQWCERWTRSQSLQSRGSTPARGVELICQQQRHRGLITSPAKRRRLRFCGATSRLKGKRKQIHLSQESCLVQIYTQNPTKTQHSSVHMNTCGPGHTNHANLCLISLWVVTIFPLETSVYTIWLTMCQSGLSGEVEQESLQKEERGNSSAVPAKRKVNNPSSSHIDHNRPRTASPWHEG